MIIDLDKCPQCRKWIADNHLAVHDDRGRKFCSQDCADRKFIDELRIGAA